MKINADNCFAIAGFLSKEIKKAYEAISTRWLPYNIETPEGQSKIAVEMVKEMYSPQEYEKVEPFYRGYDDSEANLIYELSLWFVKYISRVEKTDRNSEESITGVTTGLRSHILTLMGNELN